MNKTKAINWVNALRSGKYKQGDYYLRNNNEFCCLGVLACLDKQKLKNDGDDIFEEKAYEHIKRVTGSRSGLSVYEDEPDIDLTKLNDNGYDTHDGQYIKEPLNFDEIADIIQAVEIERVLD